MPTTDVTNSLVATITSTEQSTSNTPINRSTGNPSFSCNGALFNTYQALAAGPNPFGLPYIPATQLYVRNIDPTKTILVSWTPNGGASASIITLNPGDQIILFCNPTGTTPGITAGFLTPSAAGALVEVFAGG
jgi:hypothetical protein